MIEVTPYTVGHAYDIIYDQVRESESWFKSCPQTGALMEEKEKGYAWSLVEDGKALACGGFYRYAGKSAEAWYLMSPKSRPHLKALMRIVRNIIDTFLEESQFSLLVAHVLEEDAGGHAWARCMGFERSDILIPDGGHTYVSYFRGGVK